MNWIKRMFRKLTSRTKLVEEYIMNDTYKGVEFVEEFLDMRKKQCEEKGMTFLLRFAPFKNFETFGIVKLYYGGREIEIARLTRYYSENLLAWDFDYEK